MGSKTLLVKTLKVSDETHKELTKIAVWGENMDQVVSKCLESYKREHKK